MRLADDVEIIPISKEDPSAVNDRLKRVNELKKLNNYYVPDQYDNPYAVFGTYFYLAREIDEQLRRMGISWINLDYIVNSISTGAHSIGIGLFAKQRNKNVRIIGVEQLGSGILCDPFCLDSEGRIPIPYLVGGAGHRFPTYNVVRSLKLKDFWFKCAKVSDRISFQKCFEYKEKYNLCIGPSTGMLIAVVEAIAEGERNKNFLVISPDSFEDYPSLNTWDKIEALEEKVINERLNGFDYRKHLA